MSAIRNSIHRTEVRRKRALPYARSTGITGFFRRIFGLDGGQEHESDTSELPTTMPNGHTVTDGQAINFSRNQSNAFRVGPPLTSSHNHRQPLSQVDFINYAPLGARDPPSPSFANSDVNDASNNASGKAGTSGSTHSAQSSIPERRTTPEKSEIFRFTYTTRLESLSSTNVALTPTPSTSSTKKLKRNPNGDYRWDGPGSAKRSRQRNRFASPAFGATPTKVDRAQNLNISSGMDQKRRKTGEPAASTSESSISSLPFPITASPSASKANGSLPRPPAAVPNTSRLRTPAKPTVPVVPSPLRHAWSDSSPNSRDEPGNSTVSPAKPTQTATLIADLIKETIPLKKPDLSNPYQASSPVAKVGPPRRGARRPRPAPRPAVPAKEDQSAEEQKQKVKFEDISPQAIIEATLPKGSKRSRPPANFERSKSPDLAKAETYYQVEEPEEESARISKKSKPSLNGNGRPSTLHTVPHMITTTPEITVEEISDVPLLENIKDESKAKVKDTSKLTNANISTAAAASATTPTSRASFSALRTIPKEPSKLRFSFQAEGSAPASVLPPVGTLPPTPQSPTPAAAEPDNHGKSVPSTRFNFSLNPGGDVPKAEVITAVAESQPPTVEEVKSDVTAMDVDVLPIFSFSITAVSVSLSSTDQARAREDVKVLPPSSLPAFSFTDPVVHPTTGFKFDIAPVKSTSVVTDTYKASGIDAPPVKAFDFAAAGMKKVEEKDVWTCFCGVKNANSAFKCIACESPSPSTNKPVNTPKPVIPSAPQVKAFDFAAAGFKMPTVNKDTWTCSECTLSNPNSATTCGPCGADRK